MMISFDCVGILVFFFMFIQVLALSHSGTGEDLGTQIHFWDAFQSACKKRGMKKRDIDLKRFVPPHLAEFMAGCQAATHEHEI